MRAIAQIRKELDEAAEGRRNLRRSTSPGDAVRLVEQARDLDERIAALWIELRSAKAHVRSGPRESIIRSARAEERFNRDIRTRKSA
jgi:hypothetical protein